MIVLVPFFGILVIMDWAKGIYDILTIPFAGVIYHTTYNPYILYNIFRKKTRVNNIFLIKKLCFRAIFLSFLINPWIFS